MAKKKIVFYGRLKSITGLNEVSVEVSTVREAILAISALFPELKSLPNQKNIIQIIDHDDPSTWDDKLETDELHLAPAFFGGKKGGMMQIVIGVVLIAAAVMSGGAALGAYTAMESMILSMGISMVIGGLMTMLSPSPKMDTPSTTTVQNPEASKYLGVPRNTTKIGTRIPILYGERKVYGHYLSFDIDAVKV